jgi:malate dehydrogenase (oxaloacetate-decarboxylating)(NADP+)
VSATAGAFNEEAVTTMAAINARPIIMPLSNPTSKAECTFEEAVLWTAGKVVFASGSPFPPLQHNGTTLYPAQANNAYVFPALGHAAVLAGAKELRDDVFLAVAESLSTLTSDAELAEGRLFPDFDSIQEVSAELTARVATHLVGHRLCGWKFGVKEIGVHRG